MDGVLVLLLYIVSAVFGFCGGIFGYYFAKRKEKIKAEKEEPKTIVMDCLLKGNNNTLEQKGL